MHDLSGDDQPPPIPRELESEYLDTRFKNCTRCGESLADFPGGFQISKAWKKGECVFEYALCDHCRTALMEEFSKESKERLARFQDENVNLMGGLDRCSVCNREKNALNESDFVLTGVCEGDRLLHGIMVCGKCGERTQELLSKHTKDTWRRFRDENFPGPPGDEVLDPVEPISVLM
ncbi:MAG: hypothetical protein JNJ83_16125 [Verrucomicrobiaceae bacterium]|nr:hypothetical protein [Verrucomicrobiaceae bacterium]